MEKCKFPESMNGDLEVGVLEAKKHYVDMIRPFKTWESRASESPLARQMVYHNSGKVFGTSWNAPAANGSGYSYLPGGV